MTIASSLGGSLEGKTIETSIFFEVVQYPFFFEQYRLQ